MIIETNKTIVLTEEEKNTLRAAKNIIQELFEEIGLGTDLVDELDEILYYDKWSFKS